MSTTPTPVIRTAYMQHIMTATYPEVANEAIRNGFDGAWERLIAERLYRDKENGNSEAECIIYAVGGVSPQKLKMAAKMIINSKTVPDDDDYPQDDSIDEADMPRGWEQARKL